MKAMFELPNGYKFLSKFSLKEKGIGVILNVLGLIIMIPMIVLGIFLYGKFFNNSSEYFIILLYTIFLMILQFIIFFIATYILYRIYTGKNPVMDYGGLSFSYNVLGAIYYKKDFLVISTMPIFAICLIFFVLTLAFSGLYSFMMYFNLCFAIIMATGPITYLIKTIKLPKYSLIQEHGVELYFYIKEDN